MKAYVCAELAAVTGMSAQVVNLYEGPSIRFSGASGGKAASIEITMHPHHAIDLALQLIRCADKHSKDTKASLRRLAKTMDRIGASGEASNG